MTNQRRTIGVVAALVLAAAGTIGLVGYVQGAKENAVAGEKLVPVYVVTDKIAAGTPAASVANSVETQKVPAKVKAQDAVTNLSQVKNEVTSIDLLPGEQLVTSRFSAAVDTSSVKGVPAGLFGATFSLDPEQALGGQVRAGDHVAVVGMVQDPTSTDQKAVMLAGNVLVTSVQIDGSNGQSVNRKQVTDAPTGKFFVTVALDQAGLEKVVAAANGGRIWLATDPTLGAK